jgi:pyruvate ferredoxin oxidoreductase beta subunit/2-oxoisovalerate ferredoxin oxidoreductase beta subunit
MIRKFQKAKDIGRGTRFLHVFATCPTGWRIPSDQSVKIARLAVTTNIFPLYEVENGSRYTINHYGDRPVKEYLKLQGRFKHLTDADIEMIQRHVDEDRDLLLRKAGW